MAEALFKRTFPSIVVSSAGFEAEKGRSAAPFSVDAIQELGIDISAHKATQISRGLLCDADLILTMSRGQVEALHRIFPFTHGRVFRIGHFIDADIEDPVDGDFEKFRTCRDLLESAISRWSMYLGEEAVRFSSFKNGNGE